MINLGALVVYNVRKILHWLTIVRSNSTLALNTSFDNQYYRAQNQRYCLWSLNRTDLANPFKLACFVADWLRRAANQLSGSVLILIIALCRTLLCNPDCRESPSHLINQHWLTDSMLNQGQKDKNISLLLIIFIS